MIYSVQSGRQDCLRRSFSPPCYPKSLAPTSSGRFCFFLRFEEQVLPAAKKTKPAAFAAGFLSVGTTRFELATPCTPCKCATGLRYVPKSIIRRGAKVIKK